MALGPLVPRGKFITFEGGEGCGKTTQSKLLADYLTAQGHQVVLTREPGGTSGAMEIRSLLINGEDNRWTVRAELLLLMAARADHWEKVIDPALTAGKWVVCDRFSDSTIAYQGYGRGLDIDKIEMMELLLLPDTKPNLTILLDMDVEEGLRRAIARDGSASRFDKLGMEFHKLVYKGFARQAAYHHRRIKVIDVNKLTTAEVTTAVNDLVEETF